MKDVGRNAPCPCGSGRKYKHCCGRAGGGGDSPAVQGEAVGHGGIRPEVFEGHPWQADIFPLPIAFDDDAEARPTALLVTANELVLASETSTSPLGEYNQIAAKLARAIETARRSTGVTPPAVVVRWEEIARELRPRLPDGVAIEVAASLDDLTAAARSMLEHVANFPHWPSVSSPDSWLAWGLSRPVIAELFDAAAEFHRARPWRLLSDVPPLEVTLPGNRHWTVAIMGSGGREFGLTMYADVEDYFRMLDAGDGGEAVALLIGRTIGLGFTTRSELPRPIQREVASSGWHVAAPHAYPILLPMNTPAGGMSRADTQDLISVLRAVAAFVAEHADRFEDDRGPATAVTLHEPTGARVIYDATFPWLEEDTADPFDGDFDDDFEAGEIDAGDGIDLTPDELEEVAEWVARRFDARMRRRGLRQARGQRVPADRGVRGLPPKGSPEAVPAVLLEAMAAMAVYAMGDLAATPEMLDGAAHLLVEYARSNPDEISRVLKPEVWAAGALHAAFRLGSDTVRSTALIAEAFGVSASAVSVRSNRLREAVAWSAEKGSDRAAETLSLWDETDAPSAGTGRETAGGEDGLAEDGGAAVLPFVPRTRDAGEKDAAGATNAVGPSEVAEAVDSRAGWRDARGTGKEREGGSADRPGGERHRRGSGRGRAATPSGTSSSAGAGPSVPDFTHIQGQYLTFIHYYTKVHRRPPSERDLQAYFRVTPPSVHNMILTLARKGLISRVPGAPRSIRVVVPRDVLPELE